MSAAQNGIGGVYISTIAQPWKSEGVHGLHGPPLRLMDVKLEVLPWLRPCAAYFLMKSFPEHRFLLYGEGGADGGEPRRERLHPAAVVRDLPDPRPER
jgi:hypothetical protein